MSAAADLLERFDAEMMRVGPAVQITLTGHLLIEESINSILERYVFNAESLDAARLQFSQKVELCRGFALDKRELTIWKLISAVNRLRNAFAHSLDPAKHRAAMTAFTEAYKAELAGLPDHEQAVLNPEDERERVKLACSMCLGFLGAFDEDSKAYREWADEMIRMGVDQT